MFCEFVIMQQYKDIYLMFAKHYSVYNILKL